MSLQIETFSAVAVGIAVGLMFGFFFTMRMYKNLVVSTVTEVIEQLTQEEESCDYACSICPFNDEFLEEDNKPYSIQEYAEELGYEPKELEDEK